jgi:hypothetical protein
MATCKQNPQRSEKIYYFKYKTYLKPSGRNELCELLVELRDN